jgi:hypothetical protein
MKEYTVVTGGSAAALSKSVTEHLKAGWKLEGGLQVAVAVAVAPGSSPRTTVIFAQAMTKGTTKMVAYFFFLCVTYGRDISRGHRRRWAVDKVGRPQPPPSEVPAMSLLQCRVCYRLAAPEEKRCPRCRQLLRDPLRPPHLAAALLRERRTLGLLAAGSLASILLLMTVVVLLTVAWEF